MYEFNDFLQELSENANIPFKLTGENGKIIYASNSYVEGCDKIYFPVYLGKSKNVVSICKGNESCVKILKYTIENKYKELYSAKEQSIINLLETSETNKDEFESEEILISNKSSLFIVSISGSRYEGINIIEQMYNDENVISIIYKGSIIVIGYFEDPHEHAVSIRDAIISNLFCECTISYGRTINDEYELKQAYEEAKEALALGKKFSLKEGVLDYNKLLFEKIVYNIEPNLKREFLDKFKEKFNQFDSEMINTIEEFVKSGLNISESARKLYIHRNTLIYRLDKIKKETGFDIRNFKEATVFITAFLVWREVK